MSKNANLYIRIDQNVKTDAEELFSSFGITVTDAVNMFLHKALMVRGIPFDVVQPRYNATTEAAMGEIAEMRSGKTPKDSKSVADFAKEMGIEQMLTPVYSARFKKDFKLAQKRGLNVKSLLAVMEQLQNQELLDERLYTHRLTGNYAGYFECHISPDWLLVYLPDEAQNEIYFARTGSHSDLF